MGFFNALTDAIATQSDIADRAAAGAADDEPALELLSATTAGGPTGTAQANRPILMLNSVPVTIDPATFKNALSTANPGGDIAALWAFRQLVDPIPAFTRYYSSSGRSTESTYSLIVKGASIPDDNPFVAQVLADSQQRLTSIRYANMDDTPGTWAPVYATPADWYDTSGGRYKEMDLDLDAAGGADSPFTVLGGEEGDLALEVKGDGEPDAAEQLGEDSRVSRVHMKYLQVTLTRPWMNRILFRTNGWSLSGQPRGFCSSGSLQQNEGVLPLIPSSILLATDVTIDARWTARHKKLLERARKKRHRLSLGPFVLQGEGGQSSLQVLGWVTSLVPCSPMQP